MGSSKSRNDKQEAMLRLQVIRQEYGKLHVATHIYAIDVCVRSAACQAHIELVSHCDGQTADTSMPCPCCVHDSSKLQSNAMGSSKSRDDKQ